MEHKITNNGIPMRSAFKNESEYIEAVTTEITKLLAIEDGYLAKIGYLKDEISLYRSNNKLYKVSITTPYSKKRMVVMAKDTDEIMTTLLNNDITRIKIKEIALTENKFKIILKK